VGRAAAAVGERDAAQLAAVGRGIDHERGRIGGDPVAAIGGGRLERGGLRRGREQHGRGRDNKKAGVETPANREVHRTTLQ